MFLCQYENNYLEIFSLNNDFNFIFYKTTLLVGVYKCINDKNGGTLPVLKNEIIDVCLCPAVRKRNLWFRIWALRGYFARLGTGRTYRCSLRHNVCRPATDACKRIYNRTNHLCGKCLSAIFLILYFIAITLLVKIHISCTQKWAAGCDPPLRSVEHTLTDEIIYCNNFTRSKYYNVNANI